MSLKSKLLTLTMVLFTYSSPAFAGWMLKATNCNNPPEPTFTPYTAYWWQFSKVEGYSNLQNSEEEAQQAAVDMCVSRGNDQITRCQENTQLPLKYVFWQWDDEQGTYGDCEHGLNVQPCTEMFGYWGCRTEAAFVCQLCDLE